MKYATVFFLAISLALLCSFSQLPANTRTPAKAVHTRQKQDLPRRAADAARQMKQYRQRLSAGGANGAARGATIAPGTAARPLGTKAGAGIGRQVQSGSTLYLYDDMESGANGWTTPIHADSGGGLWHQTTRDANSPAHSWWAGVEGQGNYHAAARVSDALVSPVIDLSGAAAPVSLLFTELYVTEKGWDFCMVDVSTDGGAGWTPLRGGYGESVSGDSRGWKVSSLDLSPYAGRQIRLRFFFDTGDTLYNEFPGWFVDNVAVFDRSATIAGNVYLDMNQDGAPGVDEMGLNGFSVTASGPITLTVTTDAFGNYAVPLPLGSYQVSEALEAPWILTSSPAIWSATLDSAGLTTAGLDFGNYRTGCVVRGLVYNDLDKNGTQDPGEPPLEGFDLQLVDSLYYWVDETTTDSSGRFSFALYFPGQYHLMEWMPWNWSASVPPGDPPEYLISVPGRDTVMEGFNFGNFEIPPGSYTGVISGHVFNDLNQNGLEEEREPGLAGQVVILTSPGIWDETPVDSLGRFSFRSLPPDTYTVSLRPTYLWQQSFPESVYSFVLADGGIDSTVVFGAWARPVGTIRGNVFNDLNRNGVRDTAEGGLGDRIIIAWGPGDWAVHAFSDSTGNYQLDNVVAGPHTVELGVPGHWGISFPIPSIYAVTLGALETKDSLDFGTFAYQAGSVGGTVFNDLNANGVRDPGESPFGGAQIYLSGSANGTTGTDDSGHYRFNGLWSGSYQVRLIPAANWRQTYPALFQPHHVGLSNEENRSGVDFGAVFDSAFNLAFRTFTPESLAYARDSRGKWKSEKMKPYASEATFELPVPDASGLTALHIEFNQPVDPVSLSAVGLPPPSAVGTSLQKWDFTLTGGETFTSGEHVSLFAHGMKARAIQANYWWKRGSESPALGTVATRGALGTGRLLLQMPNAVNMLDGILSSNSVEWGIGLTVGVFKGKRDSPHSVYHPKSLDVYKSLFDRGHLHEGPPRCLGVLATTLRSITKAQKSLPPTKGNNLLFAEALALKANIKASECWLTPAGFGYLIYQDGGANRFNGMSIYRISATIDTALSKYDELAKTCGYDDAFFAEAYSTIRSIDSAFCGPMDTISFSGGLDIAPVRSLADVPFLRIDSTLSSLALMMRPPERRPAGMSTPLRFRLDQNYPNPFNPATTISFTLPDPARVTLLVYNTLGQQVVSLLDRQEMDDGDQEVEFDAGALPSGVYFYRLTAEGVPDEETGATTASFTSVKKMVVMK